MKKKIALLILMSFVLIMAASCSSNSLNDLPVGSSLSSSDSPDGTYTVNAYLCPVKGEMLVRGELVVKATGEKKNIYCGEYDENIDIEWKDDSTISIDGKTLNVETETYDCRNEK